MRNITIPIMALLVAGIFLTTSANAQPQKQVCVLEPLDMFMDKNLVSVFEKQIKSDGYNVKVLNIAQQVRGGNICDQTVKIERAINENYWLVDPTTKYVIDGSVLTVFTYKTNTPHLGEGIPTTIMTNNACMLIAHGSKYISSIGQTYRTTCNPYYTVNPAKIGELPLNVIQQSIDNGLAKLNS